MEISGAAGLVSVIMPVYRGESYVAAAIASAMAQSYQAMELVVINDGSPDDSRSQINRFLPNARIRYIEQPNSGVANARNAGIRASSGEFIALLDQDDIWLPSKLEKQLALFNAVPELGLIHSRVGCIDASGNPRSCEGAIQVVPFEGLCAGKLLAGNAIAPLTVVVRRACLDTVGMFDQRFAPADDWDLWLRVARAYPLGFLDEITALYRFHGENVSRDELSMQRAVIRTMQSICERFPDIPQSLAPTELAETQTRMFKRTAELLIANGVRGEASEHWRSAYKVNGDIEALLGLMSLPPSFRNGIARSLGRMPRVERLIRWYSYKASGRLRAGSPTQTRTK